MRFQITAKGRTVFLSEDEKACRGCGSRETRSDKWYYYDEPLSKGLYCRDCASTNGGYVKRSVTGKSYTFWEVDSFRYSEGEQEEIK